MVQTQLITPCASQINYSEDCGPGIRLPAKAVMQHRFSSGQEKPPPAAETRERIKESGQFILGLNFKHQNFEDYYQAEEVTP
jgi:hypothetical protein